MQIMLTRTLILIIALLAPAGAFSQEPTLGKAPVDADGRFYNPWQDDSERSILDLLKWKFSDNPYEDEKKQKPDFKVMRPDFKKLERQKDDWFVWLGHSTVLMRVGGLVIMTDPVFWDVNFLVKRATPFPVEPDSLPKVDIVLISHGHYDHLNTRSVQFLKERFDPLFITGPGFEDYFRSLGVKKHAPLNWSESIDEGGVKITALPVQHWSKRSINDNNRMLWCGYLVESGGRKYYWTGDTGYFKGFREIGEKYGPIDIFFGPIGSYEPRWFMKDNHMDPEEALRAAQDLKAKVFVPIHWGTFDLTDEPLDLPPKKVKELHKPEYGFELRLLDHGGSYIP